ncbi:hypothetical protein CR513_49708, partial [Mucuna pruriens]
MFHSSIKGSVIRNLSNTNPSHFPLSRNEASLRRVPNPPHIVSCEAAGTSFCPLCNSISVSERSSSDEPNLDQTNNYHHQSYAKKVLEKFKMFDCNLVNTPMEGSLKLSRFDSGEKEDPTLFKSLVGSLRVPRFFMIAWGVSSKSLAEDLRGIE